jgi:tetratricopeptide (TPR) repeat protein
MRGVLLLLWLLTLVPALHARGDDPAVEAYRAGDHAAAASAWTEALAGAHEPRERARLCYDLGNCAYRSGDVHEAVAWYTASLLLQPRNADARHNLELARSEAGLEPADRGDLEATLQRLLSALTLAESEWLLLLLLGVLAVALALEAFLGGVFERLSLAALGLVLLGTAPWIWNLRREGGHPMMVVEASGAPGRSEPGRTARVLTEFAAGSIVEKRDELPDWIEVRTSDGAELWVPKRTMFDLRR